MTLVSVMQGEESNEATPSKERPRLYLGPYNPAVIDSFYYGSLAFGISPYYYHFYRPLAFMGPVYPGTSSITVAVGSNGYFGTGFTTADRIKGTNIIYSLSASWEKGELYYPGHEYRSSTIAPSFFWSNENTSLYLGFEFSEMKIDRRAEQPRVRPRVNDGPLKPGTRTAREVSHANEFESVNLGLTQRLWDFASFSVGVSDTTMDFDGLPRGFSQGDGFMFPQHRRY